MILGLITLLIVVVWVFKDSEIPTTECGCVRFRILAKQTYRDWARTKKCEVCKSLILKRIGKQND